MGGRAVGDDAGRVEHHVLRPWRRFSSIRWTAASFGDISGSYELRFRDVAGTSADVILTAGGTNTERLIYPDQLPIGKTYDVSVRAVNAAYAGPWSETLRSAPPPPLVPQGVVAT